MPRPLVLSLFLVCLVPGLLAGHSAAAESFSFAPVPHASLNRLFRVDRFTGEVGACQFAVRDDNDKTGVTLCYPPGEGAKAGEAGDFALVPSNHREESGIFRVNRRTGEVSICYVRGELEVVCTAPAK
jgi:hypothetical protein